MLLSRAGRVITRMPDVRHMKRRSFQSRSEHAKWMDRVKSSVMPLPKNAVSVAAPSRAAPFLASVDPMAENHYTVWEVPQDDVENTDKKHTPMASMKQVDVPLSSDMAVRTAVSDLGSWSTFRLSKFYELVDALTGDVAYRYSKDLPQVAWVTAGHYFSRKIQRTDIATDVTLRSYITSVGRSSVEIRSDGLQENQLVNVCHTILVALNAKTMRPISSSSADSESADISLPPLAVDEDDSVGQAERASLAALHNAIRKERAKNTMQLRTSISAPPSPQEVQSLHELHQRATRMREGPVPRPPRPRTVSEYTFRSSSVIFPEDRNLHGKLFGGYVMSQAYNLALYAAKCFAQSGADESHTVVPKGIDEAVFHQPIAIGDLVTFTARVVHATEYTCRVYVTAQVRDPKDTDRVPPRSNRLGFVFCAETPRVFRQYQCSLLLPVTYPEILMHVEATRWHNVEGPTDEEASLILEESARLKGTSPSLGRLRGVQQSSL